MHPKRVKSRQGSWTCWVALRTSSVTHGQTHHMKLICVAVTTHDTSPPAPTQLRRRSSGHNTHARRHRDSDRSADLCEPMPLHNEKDSCFLNAVLQCLGHMGPWNECLNNNSRRRGHDNPRLFAVRTECVKTLSAM
jgi:ubiquitin C-terminal hydrolase